MLHKEVILWDFDGVILNSMPVRDQGFIEVLQHFPDHQVEALLAYHRKNGGLSRYVKFRYFYEEILKQPITEEDVFKLADSFSVIMKKLLTNKDLLIQDSMQFIKTHYTQYKMHIVSGSDQNELRFLCKELGVDHYFISIHGSPTAKKILIEEVLQQYQYNPQAAVMIGDAYNDYEAAAANGVDFLAYNNPDLEKDHAYLHQFSDLSLNPPS